MTSILLLLFPWWFMAIYDYQPPIPLDQAYQGPGVYYWRYDFAPGKIIASSVTFEKQPENWQPIYDHIWERVAYHAQWQGYPPPHDGCWERHDCPPMLIRNAEIATQNPFVAMASYIVVVRRHLALDR